MEGIVVHPPSSTRELVAELRRVGAESVHFWNSFAPEEFFHPIGEAWSPCDNVRHLSSSITPVARALRVPRPVLAALFGRPGRLPRGYEAMEAAYQKVLAEGGKAGGRFVPRALAPPNDPAAVRCKVVQSFAAANATLVARIVSWPDASLDRYQLPHPLLGRLSVREMLFFTLYHGAHHVRSVARRKGL